MVKYYFLSVKAVQFVPSNIGVHVECGFAEAVFPRSVRL